MKDWPDLQQDRFNELIATPRQWMTIHQPESMKMFDGIL